MVGRGGDCSRGGKHGGGTGGGRAHEKLHSGGEQWGNAINGRCRGSWSQPASLSFVKRLWTIGVLFFYCTRKGYQPPHIHRTHAPSHNKHGPINMQMPLQTRCLGHKAFCLVYNPGSLQKMLNNILCLCNWACLWHTTELPRGRMGKTFCQFLAADWKKERNCVATRLCHFTTNRWLDLFNHNRWRYFLSGTQ